MIIVWYPTPTLVNELPPLALRTRWKASMPSKTHTAYVEVSLKTRVYDVFMEPGGDADSFYVINFE